MSANPGNIRLVPSVGQDPHDGKRAPRGLKTSSTVLATLNARCLAIFIISFVHDLFIRWMEFIFTIYHRYRYVKFVDVSQINAARFQIFRHRVRGEENEAGASFSRVRMHAVNSISGSIPFETLDGPAV